MDEKISFSTTVVESGVTETQFRLAVIVLALGI